MARVARFKVEDGEGWYHVHAKVAGRFGEYALANPECQRKLLDVVGRYAKAYCCETAALCVMGNHWHGVFHFEAPRVMAPEERMQRALALYKQTALREWTEKQWIRFGERLFDVSELMRNIQSSFARWYNRTHGRQGRFWSERFKNTVLMDEASVVDCMLYIDLNPVRAGLVQQPEAYEGSSAFLREVGASAMLMPLKGILGCDHEKEALEEYRSRLYYRGAKPSKENHAAISEEVVAAEEARGFKTRGIFLRRLRYFTDGLIIGTRSNLQEKLQQLKASGHYKRRIHPVRHLEGVHYSLREQRSHAVMLR